MGATLLCPPEIIVGTWLETRTKMPELTENETRDALSSLDPLWNELFRCRTGTDRAFAGVTGGGRAGRRRHSVAVGRADESRRRPGHRQP